MISPALSSMWATPLALTIAAVVAFAAPSMARADASARSEHVEVRLVSDSNAIVPGKQISLALAFTVREGWHIYWRNPGDAGVATAVRWSMPKGFVSGELQWPAPRRFAEHGSASYGYGGSPWLLTRIHVPANAEAGDVFRAVADVEWLACAAICVPGEAKLTLALPVASKGHAVAAGDFARAHAALPTPAPWPIRFAVSGEHLVLDIARPQTGAGKLRAAEFYPESGEILDHAAPQTLAQTAMGFTLSTARGSVAKVPTAVAGVLVVEQEGKSGSTRQYYEVRASQPGRD